MLLVEGLRKLSQIIVNGGNASPEVLCKKYHLTKSFLHEKKNHWNLKVCVGSFKGPQ